MRILTKMKGKFIENNKNNRLYSFNYVILRNNYDN